MGMTLAPQLKNKEKFSGKYRCFLILRGPKRPQSQKIWVAIATPTLSTQVILENNYGTCKFYHPTSCNTYGSYKWGKFDNQLNNY